MCPEFLALPEVGIGNTLVRAGVIGLGLNHREAQKGILYFFEEMVSTITITITNINIISILLLLLIHYCYYYY